LIDIEVPEVIVVFKHPALLYITAQNNCLEVLQLLLKNGAVHKMQDEFGNIHTTPATITNQLDHVKIVKELIAAKQFPQISIFKESQSLRPETNDGIT
jgi:hypothetical protein